MGDAVDGGLLPTGAPHPPTCQVRAWPSLLSSNVPSTSSTTACHEAERSRIAILPLVTFQVHFWLAHAQVKTSTPHATLLFVGQRRYPMDGATVHAPNVYICMYLLGAAQPRDMPFPCVRRVFSSRGSCSTFSRTAPKQARGQVNGKDDVKGTCFSSQMQLQRR
jgi:hypothetical protein